MGALKPQKLFIYFQKAEPAGLPLGVFRSNVFFLYVGIILFV